MMSINTTYIRAKPPNKLPLFLLLFTKSSMAGLQLNFFPTDFLYPQPTQTITEVMVPLVSYTRKPNVSLDDLTKMKSSVTVKKQLKTLKLLSTSSVDFSAIDK